MAGRQLRRRYPPVRCGQCDGQARWDADSELYTCGRWDIKAQEYVGGCGWWCDKDDGLPPDDGRIRSPEDAAARVADALSGAARDGRLSAFDRRVHAVYCARAADLGWVEVMAGDEWVCEQLGLDSRAWRNRVRRARARLEGLNYLRRLTVPQVTSRRLKAAVTARKAEGKRPVTLLEVRKAPPLARCEHCGAQMPNALRASMRFCGATCRRASGRANAALEAKLDEVFAELDIPSR